MSLLKRIGAADAGSSAGPPGAVGLAALAPEPAAAKRPLLAPEASSTVASHQDLKTRVQNRLIAELDPRMDLANGEQVRRTVEETFASVLEQEQIVLTRVERMRLFEAISAEILGFGPIEPLLKDATVTEVMVNGPTPGLRRAAAAGSR